jgi:hypothetical protein
MSNLHVLVAVAAPGGIDSDCGTPLSPGWAGCRAARSAGMALAEQMREGAEWVLRTTSAWWIDVPAMDLSGSVVDRLRALTFGLAIVVLVLGVVVQGMRMMLMRRGQPLAEMVQGLVVYALVAGLSLTVAAGALQAGDAFSSWVLDTSIDGDFTDRIVLLARIPGGDAVVLIVGLLLMLFGIVQALLMMFREAALVILTGLVPLAAAGQVMPATRAWLPRVLGWMLALVLYKPIAALVYAAAFTLVGRGDDPRTVFVGLTMIGLSIVALPAMMKLFSWVGSSSSMGGGGGGLGLAAGVAAAGASTMVARGPSMQTYQRELAQSLDGGGGRGASAAAPAVSPAAAFAAAPAGAPAASGGGGAAGVLAAGTATAGTTAAGGVAAGAGAAGGAAAAGASAAAGPASVGIVGAQQASQLVRAAGDRAASAMGKEQQL